MRGLREDAHRGGLPRTSRCQRERNLPRVGDERLDELALALVQRRLIEGRGHQRELDIHRIGCHGADGAGGVDDSLLGGEHRGAGEVVGAGVPVDAHAIRSP